MEMYLGVFLAASLTENNVESCGIVILCLTLKTQQSPLAWGKMLSNMGTKAQWDLGFHVWKPALTNRGWQDTIQLSQSDTGNHGLGDKRK